MRRTAALHASGEASSSRPTLALCSFGSEMRAGQQLPPLNVEALARAYVQSTRRLILLGLDGTLIGRGSGEQVLAHLKNFHDFHGDSLPPVVHAVGATQRPLPLSQTLVPPQYWPAASHRGLH